MTDNLFRLIKDRLQETEIKFPLETEECSLIYGKIFYDAETIWCNYKDIYPLTIESGRGFAGDLLYCRDDASHNTCTYQLDSKNRLVSKDKTKIRMSNKRAIKFLCRVCSYIPKNRFQILIPKPLQ